MTLYFVRDFKQVHSIVFERQNGVCSHIPSGVIVLRNGKFEGEEETKKEEELLQQKYDMTSTNVSQTPQNWSRLLLSLHHVWFSLTQSGKPTSHNKIIIPPFSQLKFVIKIILFNQFFWEYCSPAARFNVLQSTIPLDNTVYSWF